jgi:hypothetical protein
MTRSMLIRAKESCLIVIDMQERLVPAMQAPARTIRNAKILITAAKRLGIPVLLTEQYPKGLGHTVPDLARVAEGLTVLEKLHFSCMEDQGFAAAFRALGRRQAVIAGMEAHICVMQTAATLMEEGCEVFVVTDAHAGKREGLPRSPVIGRRRHRHHRDGGVRMARRGRHPGLQGAAAPDKVAMTPNIFLEARAQAPTRRLAPPSHPDREAFPGGVPNGTGHGTGGC